MKEAALFNRAMIAAGLEKPGIDFPAIARNLPGIAGLAARQKGEEALALLYGRVEEDLIAFYASEGRLPADLETFAGWLETAYETFWQGERWLLWLRDAGKVPPTPRKPKACRGW